MQDATTVYSIVILHLSAVAALCMGGRWVVVSFGTSPCLPFCGWYLPGLEASLETSIRAVHPQLEATSSKLALQTWNDLLRNSTGAHRCFAVLHVLDSYRSVTSIWSVYIGRSPHAGLGASSALSLLEEVYRLLFFRTLLKWQEDQCVTHGPARC